jgi:hypothetical protein
MASVLFDVGFFQFFGQFSVDFPNRISTAPLKRRNRKRGKLRMCSTESFGICDLMKDNFHDFDVRGCYCRILQFVIDTRSFCFAEDLQCHEGHSYGFEALNHIV